LSRFLPLVGGKTTGGQVRSHRCASDGYGQRMTSLDHTLGSPIDDSERPRLAQDPAQQATPAGMSGRRTLVQVHQHLRAELDQLRDGMASLAAGQSDPAATRSLINRMTMRQNYWSLGAFCAAYCRVLSIHHTIEDQHLFSTLRARDARLAPVLDRLSHEHELIADLLDRVDRVLAALVTATDGDPATTSPAPSAAPSTRDEAIRQAIAVVDLMAQALLSHLAYEEEQLLGPIGTLSIMV
jgi:hypothetical protein